MISVDHDFFDEPLAHRAGERADVSGHGVYVEALNAEGKLESFTGSSFACPHITALAARARQHFPEMGSVQLRDYFRSIS